MVFFKSCHWQLTHLEFLSGNLKTRNFFFPIKMHPFVSSLFFLGNLRKKFLLPPGFELQTFHSTVLYLCLKTTKSSYKIWVKLVFMNWSNNEHRKGCILMGKIFFQVFKLRDKNSRNTRYKFKLLKLDKIVNFWTWCMFQLDILKPNKTWTWLIW